MARRQLHGPAAGAVDAAARLEEVLVRRGLEAKLFPIHLHRALTICPHPTPPQKNTPTPTSNNHANIHTHTQAQLSDPGCYVKPAGSISCNTSRKQSGGGAAGVPCTMHADTAADAGKATHTTPYTTPHNPRTRHSPTQHSGWCGCILCWPRTLCGLSPDRRGGAWVRPWLSAPASRGHIFNVD